MGKHTVLAREREVACVLCGAFFMTRHSQGKYCSPEHQREGMRISWRKFKSNNQEDVRAYYREYYKKNSESVKERIKQYHQTETGKAVIAKTYKTSKAKYPEKIAARSAVLVATRSGKLIKQPCEKCGEQKTQAHHDDYSKPLDVRWLCDRCHRIEHGTLVIDRKSSNGEVAAVNL